MLRRTGGILIRNALWRNHFLPFRPFHVTSILDRKISFNLSDIGEGIREVVIKEWFVKVGDTVEQFDNICEVQSDKASVTITSRYDGKITKLYHKVDEIALVGKPLADFEVPDENEDESSSSDRGSSSESSSSDTEVSQTVETEETKRLRVLTTPAVRRIAMEHKVDLNKVVATGKNGRVLKGDVLEFLNIVPEGTQKPHPTLLQRSQQHKITAPSDRTEPLKGVARAMVKSMTDALRIPHFAYCDEVEMTNLMQTRDLLKAEALELGVKLTFMPFMVKAASLALLKYPILNAVFDEANMSVIYKGAHNISVAIASPQGLVVPNIKNVQSKSILDIARDLNTLQEKGQKGTLSPEDYSNGTFSISNIGMVGGTYTKPVIMPPQVAIGAVGRTRAIPRFGPNDEVIKAQIMEVSWSADHRVIDGVTMAQFSNLWKKYLENPNLFLLSP